MPDVDLRLPLVGTMPWRRFQIAALVVPAIGVAIVVLYVLVSPWPGPLLGRVLLAGVAGLVGTVAFGLTLLAAVREAHLELRQAVTSERGQRRQLDALHSAAIAITQDLDLTSLLQRVVDLSRQVVECRYAALRVMTEEGLGEFLTSGITPEEAAAIGPLPKGLGVLNVVATSETSVRLERITDHPASVGFPPHHPAMATLLGTPVRFRDRTFGYIYLSEKLDASPFSADDERTVERFAAHAAAAIANAHLLAEVGRLGTLAERERIGRELHDGTLQELFAIALRLQAALPVPGESAPPDADSLGRAIEGCVQALSQVMMNIRHYVFGQGDGTVREPVDLVAALAQIGHSLGDAERGPTVKSALDLPSPLLVAPAAAHGIGQVVREALTNAVRHANAAHIGLRATLSGGALAIEVRDDGAGFEVRAGAVGHGLENMRLRAAAIGGTLSLESHVGTGTVVRLAVPIERLSETRKE